MPEIFLTVLPLTHVIVTFFDAGIEDDEDTAALESFTAPIYPPSAGSNPPAHKMKLPSLSKKTSGSLPNPGLKVEGNSIFFSF